MLRGERRTKLRGTLRSSHQDTPMVDLLIAPERMLRNVTGYIRDQRVHRLA
jgi:hypothetical protein